MLSPWSLPGQLSERGSSAIFNLPHLLPSSLRRSLSPWGQHTFTFLSKHKSQTQLSDFHTHTSFLCPPLSFSGTTQGGSSLLLTFNEGFLWQLLDLNYLSLTNIKRRLFVCLFCITKTPGEVLALGIAGSRDKWLWICYLSFLYGSPFSVSIT